MVGVPKQSRGCDACRKRRATCDLKKPECTRCNREKLTCKFPTGFTFVVNEPGSHKATYRKQKSTSTPQKEGTSNEPSTKETDKSAENHMLPTPAQSPNPIAVLNPPIYPNISSLSLLQHQLHARAISDVGSWRIHDASLMKVWMLAIQTFPSSPNPLKAAPLACYVSWSSRGPAAEKMASVSRHLYGQGLREVREALKMKATAEEDETLAACAALAMYEAIECPDSCRKAYEIHERASIKLVQLRGAKRHQRGVAHQLFLAVRVHGILDAFEHRRPNYLCTKEWMTVPWEYEEKDDYHRLVDILATGPRLLQDADDLRSGPPEQAIPKLFTLISRLLDQDTQLEAFNKQLQSSHDSAIYWEYPLPQTTSASSPASTAHQQPPFSFLFPEIARLMTLYWAMLAVLWSGLEELHRVLAEHNALSTLFAHPRGRRMHNLVLSRHWLENVRNICRSNAYAVAAAQTSQSPPVNGVALEIAVGVMASKKDCKAEMAEALAARTRIGKEWMQLLLARDGVAESVKVDLERAIADAEQPWRVAGLGDGGGRGGKVLTPSSSASDDTMYVRPIRLSSSIFTPDFENMRIWRPRR